VYVGSVRVCRWCIYGVCRGDGALTNAHSLSLSIPPSLPPLTHPPTHPPCISGKSMESIEAMVVELDPTFQVDEMLLNPHPFNLSITEGGDDEVSIYQKRPNARQKRPNVRASPFNLSITEGGSDEVFLVLLSLSRFLALFNSRSRSLSPSLESATCEPSPSRVANVLLMCC
jgi:hypothetical protein